MVPYILVGMFAGRGASGFDLVAIANRVGAPLFAFFAKENHERLRNGILCRRTKLRRQHRPHPFDGLSRSLTRTSLKFCQY